MKTHKQILAQINQHMHEGLCPTAGCIGECAAIIHIENGWQIAMLYIWDHAFHDSERVAKWFHDAGATDVTVMHVLYDSDNGDRNGHVEGGGARAWQVQFTQAPRKP